MRDLFDVGFTSKLAFRKHIMVKHFSLKKYLGCSYKKIQFKKITIALLYLILLFNSQTKALDRADADTLKAVYLYQFANFITWPKSSFETQESPIRYCVGDDGPLAELLPKVISNQFINNRPLVFEKLNINFSLITEECHLLFFHKAYTLRKFLQEVNTLPIVTVSDSEDFLKEGGVIALVKRGRKIKPMINIRLMKQQKIKVSAKLLRLSIIYNN